MSTFGLESLNWKTYQPFVCFQAGQIIIYHLLYRHLY